MILEELVGVFVSLGSLVITQTPPISRENIRRNYRLIFDQCPEDEDQGLLHREYEPEEPEESPYYDNLNTSVVTNTACRSRSICESLRRSLQVNIALLLAVALLGLITISLVYVDLNTTNSCIEWRHANQSVPSNRKILQIIGMSLAALPLFIWFPVSAAMLWGFKEFKEQYLSSLIASCLTAIVAMVYRAVWFEEFATITIYRLPDNILFLFTVLLSVYLTARKFKQLKQTSHSILQICFCLSFTFLACTAIAYIYTYVIVVYFKETQNKIKKAMIAALTPGLMLLPISIAKYLVLRRGSEIFPTEKAYVMCYFLRGGAIGLYRTMQSDFKNIWLFIALSLLHGVSNVISKATLNLRIKMWKSFILCAKKTRWGSTLEVLPVDTPRIRRFNADLEIENILFEYITVVLSQVYLVLYLITNFDVVHPWEAIKGFLVRVGLSTAIDFVFNIISVFIQVHFYDIPMRRVWLKYWRRHLFANTFIIINMVSYFGTALVGVFEAREDKLMEYRFKNCTSPF